MTSVLVAALLACLTLFTAPAAHARTRAGDLLWQDHFNPAGGDDVAGAVAAAHGRVVAVGSAQNAAGDSDFVVRTYDVRRGALLWKDRVDLAGGDDAATAVVLDNERVVVAGIGTDSMGGSLLLLRAYAARRGTLNWQDRLALVSIGGLAADDRHVVVSGTATDAGGHVVPLLRAYVAETGTLAWENRSLPVGYSEFASAKAGVALHGRRVFVAGTVRRPPDDPDSGPRCLVRAHDLRTGRILWESIRPTPCAALALATDGRRVIVAGLGGVLVDDYMAHAYDAETGQFLWEDRTFVSTGFTNAAVAVDTENRRAFVAGWVRWLPGRNNQEAFLVRAYDVGTGAMRWEDQFPSATLCLCHAHDVVAHEQRVFAVGQGPGTWLVRAYHAKRGDVLWSDDFEPVGGLRPNYDGEGALAVAFDDGRLFVVGSGLNADGDLDFILRVYDAK